MISVKQNKEIYEIRSPYDPVLISLIKNVPGRRWEPETKIWTIPKDKLGFLFAQLKGTQYEDHMKVDSYEHLNQNAEIGSVGVIPDIDISDVNFRINKNCKPFNHQLDTMKYYKNRKLSGINSGFLLTDEMGAGKTVQTMNVALYKRDKFKSKHCLIIACVNSAKYNWRDDIEYHSNGTETAYILGTRKKRDGSLNYSTGGKEKLADLVSGHMYGKKDEPKLPYFLIINIEAIRYKEGRRYFIADQLITMIGQKKIDIIALDEVHRNTSPTSLQGKQILRIKKNIPEPIDWIPITGTPITSKPTDVFLPLRLVDGHYGNSYYSWCQNYCVYGGFGGHEIVGYKNIPQLKSILEPNMLRRLKKDILDLPDKIYHTEYVENSEYQSKLYKQILADVEANRSEIVKSLNPLAQLLRLRQVNGSPELVDNELSVDGNYVTKNAKMHRLLELVDEIVESGEKIIIFSNWVEPLRTLYRFISKKHKVCCYTGTMSPDDREKHKQAFINNPDYKIILGTIGALGTSHTLTVASNIIFYDEAWVPADMEQACDRAHRPGQTHSVNIYTLITKDTVDERVHNILYKKEGIAKYIVDNSIDIHSNPELFDLLLSRN